MDAVKVSHAFDAGNYASAYVSEDLDTAWDAYQKEDGDHVVSEEYKPAFIMGFYSSYEAEEMPDAEEYAAAEASDVGQAVLRAGYTEPRVFRME
jgi:hypothetical protein